MFETIQYDQELSQRAREYLLQLDELYQAQNRKDVCEVMLYLNNLITIHKVRYHEVVDAEDDL